MKYDAEAVAQIRPTKEQIEDDLLAKAGVVGVDIGEKITTDGPTGELSIIVFVEKKKPASKVRAADLVPAEVDGIRTDVQEMEIELQHGADTPDAGLRLDPGTYDPLVGGISMGPQRLNGSGTLGALVTDLSDNSVAALTNWHVGFADAAGRVGDVMVQPGRLDGGTTAFARLTRGNVSEFVDGAIVRLDAGRAWTDTVTEIGQISGTAPASVGMAVQKRGRTTELTQGQVVSIDASVRLTYPGLGERTLRRQIRITSSAPSARFSDRGDSGSVILSTDRRAVGLLFAGALDGSSTFANPIGDVLSELNIAFNPTPAPTLPVPTSPVVCLDTPILSRLICPSTPPICLPASRLLCPSAPVACQSSLVCPTRLGCPVPSRLGCPSQVLCGPGDFLPPNRGYGMGAAGADADYWAGYLTALEHVAAELNASHPEGTGQ